MKYFFLFFISYCWIQQVHSQNANSVWIFGDSAGIDFSNVGNPVPFSSTMDGRGSCASIADTSGNLLFYCYENMLNDSSFIVHNFNHDTISGGIHLNGQGAYNQVTIIPKLNESNKYYVFHVGSFSTQGFYYSEVDMNLNGGLGEVTQKNTPLIPNTRIADCLQAVKHSNGRDWWVITKISSATFTHFNKFYIYYIDSSGISSPLIQSFNSCTDGDLQKIIVNTKGDKLMLINYRGFMAQYDFDRCTGILSNETIIFPEQTANFDRYFWEGAYSPNDSLFYTTTTWSSYPQDTSRLLQFDLYDSNIPASCDTLFEARNPYLFGAVRLAPDKKIYMATWYNFAFPSYPYPDSVYNQYNMNLSVINNPDNAGSSCDFQPYSFYLGGKRTYVGLPNNPNYSLGPLTGTSCDSLTSMVEYLDQIESFSLSPNPATRTTWLKAQQLKGKFGTLQLINTLGEAVYEKEILISGGEMKQELNLSQISKGVYYVVFNTEMESVSKKLIKQ